jgi:hypothetical protein
MQPFKKISIEKPQADIFVVTIVRPEVRNAVDVETAKELFTAFQQFDQDASAKVCGSSHSLAKRPSHFIFVPRSCSRIPELFFLSVFFIVLPPSIILCTGLHTLQVAVLCGAGGNFCSGADLKSLGERRTATNGADVQAVAKQALAPMGPSRMILSKPVSLFARKFHSLSFPTSSCAFPSPFFSLYNIRLFILS